MTPDALTKLQVLLKELFQIEAARDLDFGIYRIMNEKRDEVEEFIEEKLPKVVKEALGSGAVARNAGRAEERRRVSERVRESFGELAFTPSGELADAFHDTPLGKEYLAFPPESGADEPGDLRASIFNHLFTFFSRYYDNGDFISRRRYSKRERYAIPYNGEEVHLHWANADQYYVKSGNFFLDYAFESGGVKVRFEVVSAKTEHDNVKEGERSFVPLTEDASYDAEAKTVVVPFEWRPLTAEEKKEFGKNAQNGIIARSERDILSKFEGEMEVAKALSDPRPKKNGDSNGKSVSVLAHHLSRYARKNSSDFFVHKDLGGFLERELDFYIKNEVLDIEDLLDADGSDALAARMETVRAMRGISHSIIAFLAQIEAFQKRLFEKKKFVVSSHFCMTLDLVPEEFYEEISKNDAQYEEWEDLFATSEAPETLESVADRRSVEWLAANPHLVLDTKHFDRDFEDRLLSGIEDLDDATDGLLINSDNFQALNLIGDRYREQVKCVYIDPPYNTGNDGFIYKDRYQHSSWLTMMENRLCLAKPIISENGAIFVSIDDDEQVNLGQLLAKTFGKEHWLANAAWKRTVSQPVSARSFAIEHEYVAIYSKSFDVELNRLEPQDRDRYRNPDQDSRGDYKLQKFERTLTGARPTMTYTIETPTGPIHRVWSAPRETFDRLLNDNRIVFSKGGLPQYKQFWDEMKGLPPSTFWQIEKGYNQNAAKELSNLFGHKTFYTVKPTRLLKRILEIGTLDNSCVLDFFAGSGTTGHAVIDLNREDGGSRKYILVEQGRYFDSVLKRRIMKVVYSREWKDGKPTNRGSGVSHMFKYMTLESYEDALDNMRFDGDRGAMNLFEDDEYLLRYMLGFESRDSETLLNVAKLDSPFDYKLTVRRSDRDDGESRATCVDLPETFSYLLGMRVRSRKTFRDGEGRRYLAYQGETAERDDVAVIWRDTRGWSEAEDYERDRDFVAEHGMADGAKEVFVNGDSLIPDARPVEPTMKKLMLPEGD